MILALSHGSNLYLHSCSHNRALVIKPVLRKLYNLVMRLSQHKYALPALGLVSFSDSIFFPIPPDVVLIPMVIAKRNKAWLYATVCTITSVAGAIIGYLIGFYLFSEIGEYLLRLYGYQGKFNDFQHWYNSYGIIIIFIAGLTPLPYKVFTITSGFLGLPLGVFVLGSLLSRGLRYFLVSALLWWIGEPIRLFIEKYLFWVTFGFIILLISGFLILHTIK